MDDNKKQHQFSILFNKENEFFDTIILIFVEMKRILICSFGFVLIFNIFGNVVFAQTSTPGAPITTGTPTPTGAIGATTSTPTPGSAIGGPGGGISALSYSSRIADKEGAKDIISIHEQRLGFPIKPCRSGCNLLPGESGKEPVSCAETFSPNFLDTPGNFLDGTNNPSGGAVAEAKKYEGYGTTKTVRPQASSLEDWLKTPQKSLWIDDPDVTALGKGGERARQFLLWTLTRQSIDSSPTIMEVWKISRNIALFLIVALIIVMGIGIIVGQKNNFALGVEVIPKVIKISQYLLFVVFSAAIVLALIQVADIIMEFFIRSLGVRDLFNIFFVDPTAKSGADAIKAGTNVLQSSSEVAYRTFLGCSDLSTDMVESVRTSKFLVRFTNMTYYFIGIMFILRKVLLWFLLIVSPFLVLMAPFVTIRNISWIWIGVFFQWLFYGPLFALFLGALSNIWNGIKTLGTATNIPYIFDFSRRHYVSDIVYPTAINILYGGPAQKLGVFNSSNYVDTFAEYVIALIMLWAAILFPWWLLRIFRDYCCDGIMSMKNILMSFYQDWRAGGGIPPNGPTPGPLNTGVTGLAKEISTTLLSDVRKTTSSINQQNTQNRIETISQIKQATTQQLGKSIAMSASKITDIARFETNKSMQQAVVKSLTEISNPMTTKTSTERNKLMNIRNEISERASKGDTAARSVLASFTMSGGARVVEKQRILSTIKSATPVVAQIATNVGVSTQKATSVVSNIYSAAASNSNVVTQISQTSNVPAATVQTVLTQMTSPVMHTQAATSMIHSIAAQTKVNADTVKKVMEQASNVLTTQDVKTSVVNALTNEARQPVSRVRAVVEEAVKQGSVASMSGEQAKQIATNIGLQEARVAQVVATTIAQAQSRDNLIKEISIKENLTTELVQKVIDAHLPAVAKPEAQIEKSVAMPPTVSIEDYEEVKGMWTDQYEKGEIPVSENITSRAQWVETDVVSIANILNKLLSDNETLRNQALDEVGYILPVVMVNQMRGDELAVYLKAKLEAAKQVKHDLEMEAEITAKVKSSAEEEFVDVKRPKAAEAEKHLQMSLEQDLPEGESTTPQEASTDSATPAQKPSEV